MLCRQHQLAQIAHASGIVAATDITGFGLCGHLLEMLTASRVAATIFLEDIPVLDGVEEAIELGIESSLINDNLHGDERIEALVDMRGLPRCRVLFDPQTCGGFLCGCPQDKFGGLLTGIAESGMLSSSVIYLGIRFR